MDAECTHDGSLKHVQKFEKSGLSVDRAGLLDPGRVSQIVALQKVFFPSHLELAGSRLFLFERGGHSCLFNVQSYSRTE